MYLFTRRARKTYHIFSDVLSQWTILLARVRDRYFGTTVQHAVLSNQSLKVCTRVLRVFSKLSRNSVFFTCAENVGSKRGLNFPENPSWQKKQAKKNNTVPPKTGKTSQHTSAKIKRRRVWPGEKIRPLNWNQPVSTSWAYVPYFDSIGRISCAIRPIALVEKKGLRQL